MNKIVKRIFRILSWLFYITATFFLLLTIFFLINKFEGTELPYTVNLETLGVMSFFVVVSIFFSLVAFIINRRSKIGNIVFFILIILNTYRLAQIITIHDLIEKAGIPFYPT